MSPAADLGRSLAVLAVLGLFAGPAHAAGDIEVLKSERIEAARKAQDLEDRVSGFEAKLLELSRREASLLAALEQRGAALTATLGALMRLGRQPVEGLMATPAAIDETIRASLLLGTTVSLLADEAQSLRSSLDSLTALRRRIAGERMSLLEATAGLEAERTRLDRLLVRAVAEAQETAAAEKRQAASLAAGSTNLGDLLDDLSAVPGAGGPSPFSAARGSLPMPARGRLTSLFGPGAGGDDDRAGRHRGITIETRDDAQVIAPYDGQVVFAGPFRGYGLLLIIDHGGGYHSLMSGFSRLDSINGQWLLAGEPVGVMGHGLTGYKVLYVELRHDGVAINPLPWLADSNKKADG